MKKWKKLLQNKTASQKWLKNESKMRDFRMWVKFGGAEIEASYWSRAENRGLWLVEIGWFRKFKPSAFRPEIPFIPLILASFGVIPETKSHFAVIGSIMGWLQCDSFNFILNSFTLSQSHSTLIQSHSISVKSVQASSSAEDGSWTDFSLLSEWDLHSFNLILSHSTLIQSHSISEKSVQASSSAEDGSWTDFSLPSEWE